MIDPNQESVIPAPAGLTNGRLLFWQKAATWTFGIWAAMMPVTAVLVVNLMNDLAREQKNAAAAMVEYRQVMERRMLIVEERQNVVMRTVERHGNELDLLEVMHGQTLNLNSKHK